MPDLSSAEFQVTSFCIPCPHPPHPTTRRRYLHPKFFPPYPPSYPTGSHTAPAAAPTGCIYGPPRAPAASPSPPIVPRCGKWLASMRRVRRVSGESFSAHGISRQGQAENSGVGGVAEFWKAEELNNDAYLFCCSASPLKN